MNPIIVWFAKVFTYLFFKLRIYKLNSLIHRAIFDRKWKDVELIVVESIDEMAKKMRQFKWRRDSYTELFDAICLPQKVQAVGFNDESPHGNDCDEEAIFITNVLRVPGVTPFFFTVTWYNEKKFSGHNVCLLDFGDGYRYMDYGTPSAKVTTIDEVADLVVQLYGGKNAKKLVWCVSTKDLVPLVCKMC